MRSAAIDSHSGRQADDLYLRSYFHEPPAFSDIELAAVTAAVFAMGIAAISRRAGKG
jgi:hypothetical protein